MKLTIYQQQLLTRLRRGGKFRSDFGNWYYQTGRLRDATRAALAATGELRLVRIAGKHATWSYICHRDHVATVAAGQPVLTNQPV